jgi:hypothetical protein
MIFSFLFCCTLEILISKIDQGEISRLDRGDPNVAMFGRSFVTGRDRRAARKAARLATRRPPLALSISR